MSDNIRTSDVAIIGLSGRFPHCSNLDELWSHLATGRECITTLNKSEIISHGEPADKVNNPQYVPAGSFLEFPEYFDAAFFGMTAREAELTDPQQRQFFECCWEALECAGVNPHKFRDNIGLFAGARSNTYLLHNIVSRPDLVKAHGAFHIGLGNDLAFLTSRVSHLLDLRGPSCSLHVACSTSLVALHLACQSLLLDECQLALAGGVAINVPHRTGYLYEDGGVMSPDGHCRVFDADAGGTVFGSGVGVVVLKRLEDALRDGDTVHAVIKGSAINNDGAGKASFTAPAAQGQMRVIAEALANAAVEAQSISYVECHGTGTLLGDAVEVRALTKAFRAATEKQQFCALGSIKANVGHLDAAAGVVGLIKVILCMQHGLLPPAMHYRTPNPQIDFEGSPFYVNTELRPWVSDGTPRRAGVSAFGVGGTNAHAVVEEPPLRPSSLPARAWQLISLSARTDSAVRQMGSNLAEHLRKHHEQNLADVAYTLHIGRRPFAHRWTCVCRTREEAIAQLEQLYATGCSSVSAEEQDRKVSFLFPGQGSQYIGMGKALFEKEPIFAHTIQSCADLLKPLLNLDISAALYEKAIDINQTSLTQPLIFTVEYALARLWQSWGIQPSSMLGHSLGEYTAACLAGVMTLEEALGLVVMRGKLIQDLPQGVMLAIEVSYEELAWAINHDVCLAAINAPTRCTLSGPAKQMEELRAHLLERGIPYRQLHTSHAFHCSLLDPILEPFRSYLQKINLKAPQIPFVSTLTGDWISNQQAQDPDYWVRHLRNTVLFHKALQTLTADHNAFLIEVGPGNGLKSLARRHNPNTDVVTSLPARENEQSDLQTILQAVGHMWEAGFTFDWPQFYAATPRYRIPLPTYPFERQKYWIEPKPPTQTAKPDLHKINDVNLWFWKRGWRQAELRARRNKTSSPPRVWLFFLDDLGIGAGLARSLEEKGDVVIRVTKGPSFTKEGGLHFTADRNSSVDYQRLYANLEIKGMVPTDVACFWPVESAIQADELTKTHDRATCGLVDLVTLTTHLPYRSHHSRLRWWIVATETIRAESRDTQRPENAAGMALCKVLSQEDNVDVRWIDITLDLSHRECILTGLLDEFRSLSPDTVVVLRPFRRYVQDFERLNVETSREEGSLLIKNGVFLITGGLGAIGLLLAKWLTQYCHARIVLVGRTPLPPKDKWSDLSAEVTTDTKVRQMISALQDLEEIGADLEVVQADVADAQQLQSAIDTAKSRFGRINGIIHTAAVTTGDTVVRLSQDISSDDLSTQMHPKAGGLLAISQLVSDGDVDFVLSLSSNATLLGGFGFTAYAAANLFVDAYSTDAFERYSKTKWLVSNWDHWPTNNKLGTIHMEPLDEFSMTHDEAQDAFFKSMQMNRGGQLFVSTGDLGARYERWQLIKAQSETTSVVTPLVSQLRTKRPSMGTIYRSPDSVLEQSVGRVWQDVLGIESIGLDDDFFELGGDSLMATRLLLAARETFKSPFPLASFLENPTIRGMAGHFESISARSNHPTTIPGR